MRFKIKIAQKEEAGIQFAYEEFVFMVDAGAYEEIERDNANCTLENNLQQASTSEKQYTELLVPIPEPHQVPQNDTNVIYEVSSVEQGGGTVEQHFVNVEETRAYHESLFHNLATEVEKVNSVNRKMKETNAELTTELARYKNQEKCFEIEKKRLKYDFKIREDELLDKQIQLENKIKQLDNILIKTGQSIQTMHILLPKPDSFYHTKQKMALGYQNPFYLKQAQQKQQGLYNGKVLLEKHDPPAVYNSEETPQLAQESRLKMKQLNKEIKPENYTKINHLLGLRAQLFDKVSEQKDTIRGTSANTKFAKQSILGKPSSSSRPKMYAVTPLPKSRVFPKVKENPKKDKIGSKPDKNGKRGEAEKSQKQLQWIEQGKLKKKKKEGPKMQTHAKSTKVLRKKENKRAKVAIL
nr:hypothetical protein [Tanacetum cinerariifolium]